MLSDSIYNSIERLVAVDTMKMKKVISFLLVILVVYILSLALQIKWQANKAKYIPAAAAVRLVTFHEKTKLNDKEQIEFMPVSDIPQRKIEREKNDNFMERMKKRMQERRERIKYTCTKFGLRLRKSEEMFTIMAEKYKLVYCPIPKTGCSNLKRVMLVLNGFGNKSEDVFPRNIKGQSNLLHQEVSANFSLRSVGMPEIVTKQNFTKFIVVRHPFERALSVYNNKLVNDKSGTAQFHWRAQQIRRNYGTSERKEAEGDSPTFEEFISYLRDVNNTKINGVDAHWNSDDVLCEPCKNDYDVVAKLETIDEDLKYLMILIGAPDHLTMPGGYAKGGRSQTNKDTIAKFFGSLPKNKIDDLYEVYKFDFLSYGYTIEDVLQGRG